MLHFSIKSSVLFLNVFFFLYEVNVYDKLASKWTLDSLEKKNSANLWVFVLFQEGFCTEVWSVYPPLEQLSLTLQVIRVFKPVWKGLNRLCFRIYIAPISALSEPILEWVNHLCYFIVLMNLLAYILVHI